MHILKRLAIAFVGCVVICGCEPMNKPNAVEPESEVDASEYQGQDDRENQPHLQDQEIESEAASLHGIHGGQKFKFEPADYVGEWLVSNDDVTKIFVLDANGRQPAAVRAEIFELNRGDIVFSLDPEAVDEEGRASVYQLADQDLSIAVNLGVEVTMTVGDTKYVGQILPPEPDLE